jgi:tetratricopeptide (TPR) repeat protein
MKLRIEDIVILNEGQQAKQIIESRFSSLKNFHEKVDTRGLSLNTIINYCSFPNISSEAFKMLLTDELKMGWSEIVLDEISQIKKFVDIIFTNIFLYKDVNDLALLEKLQELIQQNNLINENSLIMRCIAKHCYYRNNNKQTIELYRKALDNLPFKYISTQVILNVELADHLFIDGKVEEAEKHYSAAASYIGDPNISKRALYVFYYKKGIMYNSSGQYDKAKEYFFKALNFATINTEYISEPGAVLMAIGSTFARENNYYDAKDFYFKSLFYFHVNDINGHGAALNNISEIYCKLGDYKKAIKYIEYALDLFASEGITYKYLACSETYAETKLMMGDFSGCYKYFYVLKMTLDTSINKKSIKNSICNMIDILNDVELLVKLEDTIIFLISNTDNEIYIEDLCLCLGRLNIKLKKKEVYYE